MAKYIAIHCTDKNATKVISILKNTGIVTSGYHGTIGYSGHYILNTNSKVITDCLDDDRYKDFTRKEPSCIDADMRVFDLDLTLIKEMISRSIEKSIVPFLYTASAGESCGGFNWSETPEGHGYWNNLILGGGEFETNNKSEKNENQLQNKTINLTRGERDTGRSVCYRQSKTTVTVGHLSHQEISC